MGLTIDHVSTAATSVAAMAAAWAAWKASQATEQTAMLVQIERDRRIEEESGQRSAELVLTRASETTGGDRPFEHVYLVITNLGPAPARDIDVRESDAPGGGLRGRILLHDFPIERLGRGSSVRAPAVLTMADASRFVVELAWTDDNGQHTERRTVDLG